MKAITICQPYAALICSGEKRVENRTWRTAHRGLIAIHAGKGTVWLEQWREYNTVNEADRLNLERGPGGLIGLGEAEMKAAAGKKWDELYRAARETVAAREDALAPWMKYGAIVAVAELTHCLGETTMRGMASDGTLPRGLNWLAVHEHCIGPWLFVLENVRPLREAVACRGGRTIWETGEAVEEVVRLTLMEPEIREGEGVIARAREELGMRNRE